MPNYDISPAGQALIASEPSGACSSTRPNSRLVLDQYPQPPSAMPFAHDSWEAMTNQEKFDHLRKTILEENKSLYESILELSSKLTTLRNSLAEHRHSATDGSVLVQYNRDRF